MAMNKGFQMMLQALGITIDPAEIEEIFRKLQKDLPAAAAYVSAQFESIAAQLREVDTRMREIEAILREYGASGRIVPLEVIATVLEPEVILPEEKTKGVKVNGKAATD